MVFEANFSLVPIRRHFPINKHASRHCTSHGPIKRHTCKVVFMKGAPKSASKLSTDPSNKHTSYFQKCTGSNERSVPINGTVSCTHELKAA